MYKKIMITFLVFLAFSNVHVTARDERQYFKIYGDASNPQEAYEIKNELIAAYQQLVLGLDSNEYSEAIKNYFSGKDNVSYDHHLLTITLGQGDGVVLEGELKTNYCAKNSDEIETHFFFWELFGGN